MSKIVLFNDYRLDKEQTSSSPIPCPQGFLSDGIYFSGYPSIAYKLFKHFCRYNRNLSEVIEQFRDQANLDIQLNKISILPISGEHPTTIDSDQRIHETPNGTFLATTEKFDIDELQEKWLAIIDEKHENGITAPKMDFLLRNFRDTSNQFLSTLHLAIKLDTLAIAPFSDEFFEKIGTSLHTDFNTPFFINYQDHLDRRNKGIENIFIYRKLNL